MGPLEAHSCYYPSAKVAEKCSVIVMGRPRRKTPLSAPGVPSGVRKAPGSLPETATLTRQCFWHLPAERQGMQQRGFLRAHTAREGGNDRRRKTRMSPGALTKASPRRTTIAGCCTRESGTRRTHHAEAGHAPESVGTPGRLGMQQWGFLKAYTTREGGNDRRRKMRTSLGALATASPRRTTTASCCTGEQGTRRTHRAQAGQAPESVATSDTGREER
ncbi:hypothetical protein NDU88_004459 [Pleurodeles waltl]|uniref:Uncharacterized protein n=1 Tax=Pleurodeles waltl TaxID=8319 RepID=A0AAV7KZY8_PLEWA|nr:hypothetical protein NDU88_004459 [Pleurodeles waltl]